MALLMAGISFDAYEIVLRDKPLAMLSASPKGTVPVLVLPDGRILEQSWDIVAWALSHEGADTQAQEAWRQSQTPQNQQLLRINMAKAHTTLNAAAALLESEMGRIGQASWAGLAIDLAQRTAVRANCTWVVKTARQTAQELCDQAGTSAYFMNCHLQRFHRELSVMSSHSFYDNDRMHEVYGRALFGLELPPGELV